MFGGWGDDIFYLKDALDPSIGDFRTIVDTADIIKDFEQGQDKIRVGTKEHVIYQNVTVGGTDTYTLIFGLKDEGGTHVRGIIEGDVDLTRSDFKNARSVAEIDAVSVDAWPDDSHELPELLSPVGDAGIIWPAAGTPARPQISGARRSTSRPFATPSPYSCRLFGTAPFRKISKPRLAKFKRMIAAIKAGDWDRAAIEALDSRWAARSATAPPKSPRCCAAILPVLSGLIIFAVQRVDDRDHQGH
jgi:hypothetical protein